MMDTMNDPSIDAKRRNNEKAINEGDTCRICRGEGSQEEPLFYPCKCSGSIKYVHQACLMEWLSHSQKKHCELCKTPFRFTKLYDPHMPNSVPLRVFFKQASLHVVHSLMTWARWNLVIFVWLGWVPWCMRTIWRGLFWIGDGAWISRQEIEKHTRRIESLAATVEAQTKNNATSFLANATSSTSATIAGILPKWGPISQTLNSSVREPAIVWLSRRMLSGFVFPYNALIQSQNTVGNSTSTNLPLRSPSVLSDVKFLTKLTRWRTLNSIVIDILEGQLITLSIVVAFILVFLIREWVVQQQPIVNFVAAAEDARALEDPARIVNRLEGPILPQDDRDVPEGEEEVVEEVVREEEKEEAEFGIQLPKPNADTLSLDYNQHGIATAVEATSHVSSTEDELPNEGAASGSVGQRQLRRMPATDFSLARSVDSEEAGNTLDQDGLDSASRSQETDSDSEARLSRPSMPAKDTAAQATDIQRTLEEESGASGKSWPGVDVFMDLWNRADGDPDQVLRIIEQEGQVEQFGWIVSAMKRLQKSRAQKSRGGSKTDGQNDTQGPSLETTLDEQGSQESNESWQVVDDLDNRCDSSTLLRKELEPHLPGSSGFSDESTRAIPWAGSSPGESSSTPAQSAEAAQNNIEPSSQSRGPSSVDIPQLPYNERNEGEMQANEAPTFRAVIRDWLWGGIPPTNAIAEEPEVDEEHVVENIAEEAPFVPAAEGQPIVAAGDNADLVNRPMDPEIIRAANEAGINPNDVEAIEEGEDLEGVMELIGVQGPIGGLVQNGIFSTVLISMTVLLGIWVPYIFGKLILVFVANPTALLIKMPLRWMSTTADMIVDSFIFLFGCAFYWLDRLVRCTATPLSWAFPFIRVVQQDDLIPITAHRFTWNAAERLARNFFQTSDQFSDLDIPIFSIVAHESLQQIENSTSNVIDTVFAGIRSIAESSSPGFHILNLIWHSACLIILKLLRLPQQVSYTSTELLRTAPLLLQSNPLKINLDVPARTEPLDYDLAAWGTRDRIFTIFVGYGFFSIIGVLYLKARRLVKDFHQEAELGDGAVIDGLNQAAGVLKVILIITIEMIIFPLYCGMLLDIALLPLFEDTTIVSRLLFTAKSPATSLFVHWFVGTCYMFHFALFVSMCRKIMRSGVLYFIRDPDDPSFHPVRDVLERNVSTQLRKILFSALVYGGLVIICLGAVVWGLSSILRGVFPIYWSSNEPVLEFPVDLLVYNFLMPVAIRFFRPSTGLQDMYKWWFRKCARALRLTNFLFGEKKDDEEGYYTQTVMKAEETLQHQGADTEPQQRNRMFVRDGRLVRVPASDSVRIPKGNKTFVEIDQEGNRLDGLPDNHHGLHGRENRMFSSVYIPPNFRLRIAGFILLLWLFAATTGLSLTILPLVFGRFVFAHLVPSHPRVNDIYAFAIGMHLLGGPLYLIVHYRNRLSSPLERQPAVRNVRVDAIKSSLRRVLSGGLRLLRVLYFYGAFTILLPSLFACVYEAYLLVPLHTYFSRDQIPPTPYTVHFISDWTLGVLYVRVGIRLILQFQGSRPSRALRALVSQPNNGASWLDPDIRLATRAFILPLTILHVLALVVPLGLGWAMNATWFYGAAGSSQTVVYRYAYPAVLFFVLAYALGRILRRALGRWRSKVKDEVYLIGERLHNFGEKRPRVNRLTTQV